LTIADQVFINDESMECQFPQTAKSVIEGRRRGDEESALFEHKLADAADGVDGFDVENSRTVDGGMIGNERFRLWNERWTNLFADLDCRAGG
jgi:hypothetical protein